MHDAPPVPEEREQSRESLVLAVVHGDVDYQMQDRLLFVDAQGNSTPFPTLSKLNRYLEYVDRVEAARLGNTLGALMEGLIRRRDELRAEIEREVGSENVNDILNCKQMVFLVDSDGGSMVGGESLQRIAKCIRKNGGEVQGFIGNTAGSAAAEIMQAMDKRYALQRAQCMWHCRAVDDSQRTARETEHDTHRINEFFERNVRFHRNELRQRLQRVMIDPDNADCEFHLSGGELGEYGIVNTVESVSELRSTAFAAVPALASLIGKAREHLDQFFKANELEEAVRTKFGVSIIITAIHPKFSIGFPEGMNPRIRKKIVDYLRELRKTPSGNRV